MTGDIYKTYLFFSDFDQGHEYLIDTIHHDGAWWLVGSWLQDNATGARVPERLVRLTGLPHQEMTGQPFRFVLSNSISKSVLEGQEQDGFVILMLPVPADTQAPKPSQLN
jgi:hypothetical protein